MSDPYRGPRVPGLHCPSCGTPTPDSPRGCPKCGTLLATVRCGDCFHMNPPDHEDCAKCRRPLGLEPLGEPSQLSCPDCQLTLEVFRGNPGQLFDCGRCGGQFLEHELLLSLLDQRELYGKAIKRKRRKHNPLAQPVRYVRCPVCRNVMTRKNFGETSGVIVDVCARHGTWFDSGELPHVLEFVEAGGLAELRRRGQERDRKRRHRQQLDEVEERLQAFRRPVHPYHKAEAYREAGEAAVWLASYLGDLLRR